VDACTRRRLLCVYASIIGFVADERSVEQRGRVPARRLASLLHPAPHRAHVRHPPIIRPVLPHLLCSIRAVINLEAAGTTGPELLFQATSEEMIRAYSKVPYPLGTVVATDTFKTGVMLSEYAAPILCRTPVALIRCTARTSGSSSNT
jgi:hypothetical protein